MTKTLLIITIVACVIYLGVSILEKIMIKQGKMRKYESKLEKKIKEKVMENDRRTSDTDITTDNTK